jgi:hypothetical protein
MATHLALVSDGWQFRTTDAKAISDMDGKGFERIFGSLPGFTYFRIPRGCIAFRRERKRRPPIDVSAPRWSDIRLNRW